MTDWAWQGPERRAYTRREWVSATAASVLITPLTESAGATGAVPSQQPASAPLPLTQFSRRACCTCGETRVPRARFPVIDFHTHVSRRRAQSRACLPAELVKTMDAVNLHTMVNLTGGTGDDLAGAIAGFDRAFPAPIRVDDRADVDAGRRARLRGVAGRRDRQAKAAGAVGVKILKTLGLYLRDGGRRGKLVRVDDRPVRSDVGAVRPARPAGGDPRRRSGGVLPADRSLQRALRGAQRASRLVVPRQGLSRRSRRFSRRAIGCSRGIRRRRSWRCTSVTGRRTWRRSARCSTSSRTCTSRLARASASSAASRARRRGSSTSTRIGSCSAPTRSRSAPRRRSRCSAKTCTRSITASSKPRTSTSTTRRRRCRRRADGGSTASGCAEQILRKVYSQNAERVLGRQLVTA